MITRLRVPFFIAAIVCLVIAFAVEIGSQLYLGKPDTDFSRPGLGIANLALLDSLLLFTLLLMAASLIIPDRIHGRIQGIITFFIALAILGSAIFAIIKSFTLLMLMVSLLLSVPFGTAVYFAKFANFDVGAAAITLTFIMTLKVAFVIFLVLAHQRFLQNKGLVFLIISSFITTILLSFLHALVPSILAYITDDIAGLVTAVLAALWALYFILGSLPAIFKALRIDRAFK